MHHHRHHRRSSRSTAAAVRAAGTVALAVLAGACATGPPVEAGGSADLSEVAKAPNATFVTPGPGTTTEAGEPAPPAGQEIKKTPDCSAYSKLTVASIGVGAPGVDQERVLATLNKLGTALATERPELSADVDAVLRSFEQLARDPGAVTDEDQRAAAQANSNLRVWFNTTCIVGPGA